MTELRTLAALAVLALGCQGSSVGTCTGADCPADVDGGGGGPEGEPCPDGGMLQPELTVLAAGSRPQSIALDQCWVYWTDQEVGGLMRVPKTGGAAVTLVASHPPTGATMASQGVVVDGANAYWTEYVSTSSGTAPLRSGDMQQTSVVTGESKVIWQGTAEPTAVAVASTTAYVLQQTDVEAAPIAGGATSTLATSGGLYGLLLAGMSLYWTPYNEIDAVYSVPLSGGTVATFATGTASSASSLAITSDGANIYWSDTTSGGAAGSVYENALGGGPQTTLLSGAIQPLGLATDGTAVYVAAGLAGTVLSVPVSGGSVTTLATGQGTPVGIAVDDHFVYWVNNAGGASSVVRIGK